MVQMVRRLTDRILIELVIVHFKKLTLELLVRPRRKRERGDE
jgi:hypothetical protein